MIKWKFTGHELDRETGLYYAGARYYDPKISVFLSVDVLMEAQPNKTPYHYTSNNPINRVDPDGRWDDWVERTDKEGNKSIVWDKDVTSANDKNLKEGDRYLGKNGLVATHNRDENLNEPINTAQFDLYLESNKEGPSATIMGNTVPADVEKYGTLAEGLYPAKVQARYSYTKKGKEDLAIIINEGKSVPTAPGSPKESMTEIFFHAGNDYRESLFDSKGNAYSRGCQTGGCYKGAKAQHNEFVKTAGTDFKGFYYLRSSKNK